MDSPKKRKRIQEYSHQKSEDTDEGYLTYREIVKLVKEKNKGKHRP